MGHWREVTHHYCCSVCGKSDWCSRSADGKWAICRRLDTGDGIHRADKAGIDYWLYRMNDNHQSHHIEAEISLPRLRPLASPDILHRVYQILLGMLPLEDRHRQDLHRRGLSNAEIRCRQYRTLPSRDRADFARRLVDVFGSKVCARIPGLYVKGQDGRRWWSLAGAPGLVIPIRDLDGRIVALKVRSDDENPDYKYTVISSKNRGGPGPGAPLHVPRHKGLTADVVRVTEGELKADIATALTGVLTIAVPGVSAWRAALPVMQWLQPLTIWLAFDADWRANLHVTRGLVAAAWTFMARGWTIAIEVWEPWQGKGIDDVVAAGYQPTLQTTALAFGLSVRSQARPNRGQLDTVAAEEIAGWLG